MNRIDGSCQGCCGVHASITIYMFYDHLCLHLVLVTLMHACMRVHACVYECEVKTSVTWEVIHTTIQQLTQANVLFTVPFSIWGREVYSGETKFRLMKQVDVYSGVFNECSVK